MAKYRASILAIKRSGKKGDKVTLHQRLYYQKEQWQSPLNISVLAENYDKTTNRVVGVPDADRYNYVIDTSLYAIRDAFMRFELVEHKTPTLEEVIQAYEATMVEKGLAKSKTGDAPKEASMQEVLEQFIDKEGKQKDWTEEMKNKFRSIRGNLNAYRRDKDKTLYLSTLTEKELDDFADYLRDDVKILNSTLTKKVSELRWFLRWCAKHGLYKGNLHDTYRPKYKGGYYEQHNIIYLTADELKQLEEYEIPESKQYLERTRDIFLFSCYSGLRYSDVAQLRPEHIIDDSIQLVTQKTSDRIIINLNKHTREILKKYEGWSMASGKSLPVPTNQKVNKFLHELCELAGIDTPTSQIYFKGDKREEVWLPKYEYITFHAGRRTFITQALRLGIPTPVIMKFSGHKSTAMLKAYLEVVDELKKTEMAKFDSM